MSKNRFTDSLCELHGSSNFCFWKRNAKFFAPDPTKYISLS
ncbi:hypothetical protein NY78_2964 [Desulfovibrio sp. TomC]|nr:hypothetical protein NY78_2964 [Desulfovibrio sp. TomC]